MYKKIAIQILVFVVCFSGFIGLAGFSGDLIIIYPNLLYFFSVAMFILIILSIIWKNRILMIFWILAFLYSLTAIPKLPNLIWKSVEGRMCGNLAVLRSRIHAYHEENKTYPQTLEELNIQTEAFILRLYPEHDRSTEVIVAASLPAPVDTGTWLYNPKTGDITINCTHYKKNMGHAQWSSL